jgi:segregation and condensation protein B
MMSDDHDTPETTPETDLDTDTVTETSAAPSSISYAALIGDPFGLRTLEISDAQNSSEELMIDEPIETEELDEEADKMDVSENLNDEVLESPLLDPLEFTVDTGELDRLSTALNGARAENEREATDWVADPTTAVADWTPDLSGAEAREKLATQIAEDQALQAHEAAIAAEALEELDPELLAALPKVPAVGEQLDLDEIQSCVEAILFMSDKPLSLEKIQEMIGPDFPHSVFQEAMTALVDRSRANSHGVEIVQIAKGYQLRTKPGRAALIKKLSKVQTQRLSSGAMETLAICAYRQPIMKEDVDKVRGVDSSYFFRYLLDRKLIQICGRSELPGRPMLYSTTDDFLSLFGLKDLSAMPSLREIEQLVPSSQSANPDDEDPRVKEMRRLVSQMKADKSSQLNYDPREDEKILKEIRERVQSIPTSTPSLDLQRDLEKQAKELAKQGLTLEMVEAAAAGEAVQPLLSPTEPSMSMGTPIGLEDAAGEFAEPVADPND